MTVFGTGSSRIDQWLRGEPEEMVAAYQRVLDDFRPDVLVTYGGDAVTHTMIELARRRGVVVVFWLHNFAYHDASLFGDVHHVIVPSEFSRAWYRERLGLECRVLPYAIEWSRVECRGSRARDRGFDGLRAEGRGTRAREQGEGSGVRDQKSVAQPSTINAQRYVTFVNPQPAKGLFVFARIAEQIARRRPDIPILVVESRGRANWLERVPIDLSFATNLHMMENTPDPRDYYAVTRLLLAPSLWNESFGLVAAEAMINGIPVLASDRGALPEVLGGRGLRVEGRGPESRGQRPEVGGQQEETPSGGFLFHISEKYTPETARVPTAEEVELWVQTIFRLWDDDELYRACSEQARTHARRWHPDRLGPVYEEFFGKVVSRRGSGKVVGGQLSVVSGQQSEMRHQGSVVASDAAYRSTLNAQPSTSAGLTSIVIVTHNQLSYTRLCLASIARHTPEPHELVVVDNGSTDGTVEWLKGLGLRVEGRGPDERTEVASQRAEGRSQRSASAEHFPVRVQIICNTVNRGFPTAANQGMRAASGSRLLLLNNDTVVTERWLTRMLRAADGDGNRESGIGNRGPVGLVGPVSNFVSGPQQIEVPVKVEGRGLQVEGQTPDPTETLNARLSALNAFARVWGEANERRIEEVARLVGFCLLIRREVIERIGLLDEQFGIGCFEDDDLCLRARKAGYRCVIARDAFVHHFGGATFVGERVDHGAAMREGEQRFREKWGPVSGQWSVVSRQSPADSRDKKPEVSASPIWPSTLAAQPSTLLSLCMIVRDNERTIRAALEGIRPWVDEMVVVDTGSRDATPQICAGLGARVFHFPWCDDFSAARNESVRQARGRWIFWMDSDDTIDVENGRKLRELVLRVSDQQPVASGQHPEKSARDETDSRLNAQASTLNPPVLGYLMQVHCPTPSEHGEPDMTAVDHVKLFRNLPPLRFEGRIHEQILLPIRRAGGRVEWTDIFVVHSGADQTPEGRRRKQERDLRLLHMEEQERPNHPFVLFNLGMTYADVGDFEKAAGYLSASIAASGHDDSHVRKAYALLVHCYRQLGQPDRAGETCLAGLARFPHDAELRFRQAIVLHQFGRLQDAAAVYRSILETTEERHLASVDSGIKGFRARQNLAAVLAELGDLTGAEQQYRLVVEEVPRYRPGWLGLSEVLRRLNIERLNRRAEP